MGNKFRVFGAIEKVEALDDGTLKVSGVASSETEDAAGETVMADAMKAAIPDYMKFGAVREMHQPIAAGTALAIDVDDAGVTHFEAHVVDAGSVQKVNTGVLKGFSIGGKVTSRDPLNKKAITGLKLTEISLVDVPCNPDATFSLVKFETEEAGMDGEKIEKGMWGVQDFASLLMQAGWLAQDAKWEAEAEGDGSPVAGKLREWLAAGAEIFKEMVAEEVSELLASLAPKGAPDVEVITAAAGTGDLAKKGAKFSKETKADLDAKHKAATDAHAELGKCLDALGKAWEGPAEEEDSKDGDDKKNAAPAGDLQKAADETMAKVTALTEANAGLTAERDTLQKTVTTLGEDLKKAQAATADLEAKLATKGATKVVPVEKKTDSKKLGTEADAALDTTDPIAVMKAAQGMPVGLMFNHRPANLG